MMMISDVNGRRCHSWFEQEENYVRLLCIGISRPNQLLQNTGGCDLFTQKCYLVSTRWSICDSRQMWWFHQRNCLSIQYFSWSFIVRSKWTGFWQGDVNTGIWWFVSKRRADVCRSAHPFHHFHLRAAPQGLPSPRHDPGQGDILTDIWDARLSAALFLHRVRILQLSHRDQGWVRSRVPCWTSFVHYLPNI